MQPAAPPAVSVIMPVYNAGTWLAHSIGSLRAQTFDDWELLAVDDGSKDDSLARLRALSAEDARIRVVEMPANGGVAAARNAGIAAARGRFIAFLDSDDAWAPDKLRLQVDDLLAHGHQVSYCAYQRVDEQGRPLSLVRPPSTVDHAAMLRSNHIGNLTGMYDARLGPAAFRRIGHEDYVFWLERVRVAGAARCVPGAAPLAFYTVRGGSVSSNKLRAAGWQWRIYREVEGLGPLRAGWLMLHYLMHALRKRGGAAA